MNVLKHPVLQVSETYLFLSGVQAVPGLCDLCLLTPEGTLCGTLNQNIIVVGFSRIC